MGADDEQLAALSCYLDGHDWRTIAVTSAREGAYVERTCARCGMTAMVGPDELGGWV